MRKTGFIALVLMLALGTAYLVRHGNRVASALTGVRDSASSRELNLIPNPRTAADKIVNGAKLEAIHGVSHEQVYAHLSYPNGDVPRDRGACVDVIIRSLRCAGFDLQKLIHEDMERHFDLYPRKWGLARPDSNIDHRRVPNQIAFMKRFGKELPVQTTGEAAKTWQPGDLVYWNLGFGCTHCGVISNDRAPSGLPLVIHSIGPDTHQSDDLNSWKIIGHFRYPRSG